jgi:hypothetical protein
MQRSLSPRRVCILAALALIIPDSGAAQHCNCGFLDPAASHVRLSYQGERVDVSGILVDLATERPLVHALISTPRPGGGPGPGALSDSLGWFRYSIPMQDSVEILVQLIGHSPVSVVLTSRVSSKSFAMFASPTSLCPLTVTGGAGRVPRVSLTFRDVRSREVIGGTVALTIDNWNTGETVKAQVAGSNVAEPPTLQIPGVYTVTAEVQDYRPQVIRKLLVHRDPCHSAYILDQHIDAWLIPDR